MNKLYIFFNFVVYIPSTMSHIHDITTLDMILGMAEIFHIAEVDNIDKL